MDKYHSMMLALLASCGFIFVSSQQAESGPSSSVGVVDYGEIIWRLDRVRVYKESSHGMVIPDFDDEQSQRILKTLEEIDRAVEEIMEEHGFTLVIRMDSLPDREKNRADFDVRKLFRPAEETRRNEVNRLLRKRVVRHEKLDLTSLVKQRVLQYRQEIQ